MAPVVATRARRRSVGRMLLRLSRKICVMFPAATVFNLGENQFISSSRMPGNHIHGKGLPATFVPGRRNVCEGYWAVDEI